MSSEEEMAVRGRMLTEYLEAKNKLTAVEDELRHLGERMHAVAQAILSFSERDADFSVLADPERIRALFREAENVRGRKTNLQFKLKSLGLSQLD